MYKIQTNPYQNRITIVLSGRIDAIEAQDACSTYLRELNRMKPGFDAIADFRFLREVASGAADVLPVALDAAFKAGATRAVRIVGGSREGIVVFAAASKDFQQYPVKYVRTAEEAEQFLMQKTEMSEA
jgi:hypothetical protein